MTLRQAVFAGSWYPDTATGCETAINGFLKEQGFHPPRTASWWAESCPMPAGSSPAVSPAA